MARRKKVSDADLLGLGEVALPKKTRRGKSEVADFPFYQYLWQFYSENKSKIWGIYTPLTRKFLRFNDPGPDEKEKRYLHKPQYEALEMYVFLKEYCENARLSNILKDWQNRIGAFEGRGNFKLKIGELSLMEAADAKTYEAAFKRMAAGSNLFPNYIYALTMGLGKTTLMATCIFYEFLLAKKYPQDRRYCHNALVFAPDKTVLQSLKEIQTLDKSKVVPPEHIKWLDANLKFHFLDDTSTSLSVLENSDYNIIITNNQKIILKKSHKDKSVVEQLFKVENKYKSAQAEAKKAGVTNPLADILGEDLEVESEEDLIANQRFEMLKRLRNLGVYVDEAHHAFGSKLEGAFDEKKATSLRNTINQLAAHLKAHGTGVVACYNYTGTPYVNNTLLPEVVYTYTLKSAIENKYLKQAEVNGYENVKNDIEFLRAVIKDFWSTCGERRVEGMLPKLAIYAPKIEDLDKKLRPALEKVLVEMGISTDKILRNVGDGSTTNDEEREFLFLDTPQSEKQFILLVNKGREGWNCRSLFGVALNRDPDSKIFVLQATMRCMRRIGTMQETGHVYLSESNKVILNDELQNNFQMNVEELNSAGEKHGDPIKVRQVPPPIKVKMRRRLTRYEVYEKQLSKRVQFGLKNYDLAKYEVVVSKDGIEKLGKTGTSIKEIVSGVREKVEFSAMTLVAEIARYLNLDPIRIESIVEESEEGLTAVLTLVNEYNDVLYDEIIPRLFKELYETKEFTHDEPIEVELVKLPDDKDWFDFHVKPGLLAEKSGSDYKVFDGKSFHLDNYCFDSKPEMAFFWSVLHDENVEKVYFTGMLTHGQTEFYVSYIDPETKTLKNYYPDFLVQKKDGSYLIIEVKGEHMIEDPVVQAKKEYAQQLASASQMEYLIIPGKLAEYGLKQPAHLLG